MERVHQRNAIFNGLRARILGDRETQARVVLSHAAVRGRVVDSHGLHDRIIRPISLRDWIARAIVLIDRFVRSWITRLLPGPGLKAQPRISHPLTVRDRVEARRARAQKWDQALTTIDEIVLQKPPSATPRIRRRKMQFVLPPRLIEFLVVVALAALFVGVIMPALHTARMKMAVKAQGGPASPQAEAAAPQSLPVTGVKPSKDLVRILLLGSDMRQKDRSFRTDVIMLVTVDPEQKQVSILSFPRDLIAKIPNYGEDRINTVMGRGGFKLLQNTLEQNFGARPNYYFLTNFEGFTGMINSIGGINVNASEALEDACDLPQSHAGVCKIEPGVHAMDGATALWYIRSRHSSSDFDRLRRAQEVMAALFARFMETNAVYRLPELYGQYRQDVETNMDIPHMIGLLPTALQVVGDPGRIHRFAVSHEQAGDYWTAQGAQVLLPDYAAIRSLVAEASFGK